MTVDKSGGTADDTSGKPDAMSKKTTAQEAGTTTGSRCSYAAASPIIIVGFFWGLVKRSAANFSGTYSSTTSSVYRAGFVADMNAIALAIALILLLTSGAAFHHAEESTQELAWRRLIKDTNYACVTGTRDYVEGSTCPEITAACYPPGQTGTCITHGRKRQRVRTSLAGEGLLLELVRQLQNCTKSMACKLLPTDAGWPLQVQELSSLAKVGKWTDVSLVRFDPVQHPAAKAPEPLSTGRRLLGLGNAWKEGRLLTSIWDSQSPPTQPYSFDYPDHNFPMTACANTSLGHNSAVVDVAFPDPVLVISGKDAPSIYCSWSGPVKGECMGNFSLHLGADYCTNDTEVYFNFPVCSPYRCINGADVNHLSYLNDELKAAQQEHKVWYFGCLSYDELFGVYIGVIGVAVTVCLGTFVLFSTDVVAPLFRAGAGAWVTTGSPSTGSPPGAGRSGGWFKGWFNKGMNWWSPRQDSTSVFFNIFLRCLVSCVLGAAVGVVLLFCPWYYARPCM